MIRSGHHIRFTAEEIEEGRRCGLDLQRVKTTADLAIVEVELIRALAEERPALLYKIAVGLARVKGLKLPPKLTVVE